MDAVRPSMQPWRSRRALDRKEQEEQQQRNGKASGSSASQQQQQRWRQDKPALSSEKALQPQPPKADRFKPAPALKSSGGGIPLELLASPSRGLDAGSTFDLTQVSTQEAYRSHISERITKAADQHGKLDASTLFPWPVPGQQAAQAIGQAMMATLTDVLLLVRRLREGCVAAKRADHFAIDVYALSSLLSLLVNDGIQLSSSLPRLVDLLFASSHRLTPDCFAKTLSDLQTLFSTESNNTAASPNEELNWLEQSVDPRHFLSLHLLWHSTTGGLVERIGGRSLRNSRPSLPSKTIAWNEALYRIQEDAHFSNPQGAHIDLSIAVHDCLTRRQPLALRKLILKQDRRRDSSTENRNLAERGDSLTMWHRALLIDSIEAMRTQVWSTLERAYKQIPLEKSLIASNKGPIEDLVLKEDWIERMLLLDTELFQPTEAELRGMQQLSAATKIAEHWDQKEKEEMYSVRQARLTHFFKSMESANPSQLLLKCKDILSPNEFRS